MYSKYLIGGGWDDDGCALTYGPFIRQAASGNKMLVIAAAVDKTTETSLNDHCEMLNKLGVKGDDLTPLLCTPDEPLTKHIVEQNRPGGIFVCGGLTPAYQEALCAEPDWLDYLAQEHTPYAGFSAGAAIAPAAAIVGGWQLDIEGRKVAFLDEELAEELDALEIRRGLGIAPFTVDVHASQWGTLSRLIHATDQGLVTGGVAIDENTMLELRDDTVTVHGLGQVYRVEKIGKGEMRVTIYRASDILP